MLGEGVAPGYPPILLFLRVFSRVLTRAHFFVSFFGDEFSITSSRSLDGRVLQAYRQRELARAAAHEAVAYMVRLEGVGGRGSPSTEQRLKSNN